MQKMSASRRLALSRQRHPQVVEADDIWVRVRFEGTNDPALPEQCAGACQRRVQMSGILARHTHLNSCHTLRTRAGVVLSSLTLKTSLTAWVRWGACFCWTFQTEPCMDVEAWSAPTEQRRCICSRSSSPSSRSRFPRRTCTLPRAGSPR